jgi:nitrate reductase NapAB chaperone NapD
MSIIGIVLTLSPECDVDSGALAYLGEDPRVEIGEACAGYLPVVIELRSPEEERYYLEALRSTPGVVSIDVAFAALEQQESPQLHEANA